MKETVYRSLLAFLFLTFLSCEEILLEEDISDEQVTLIAPVNNAQFFSTGISFTWAGIENVATYRLQVAKPDFTNPMQIVLDTLVTGNTFAIQLNIDTYEWRVRGENTGYHTPYANRFLTVAGNDDFQSNSVILLSPSNNLATNAATQNLSWQAILGATSYQFQIYDAENAVISDQTIPGTTLSYTFPQGSYQWRVRASNGAQQTLYSSRSILVDTTAPNAPILSSPSNISTVTDSSVSFQWTRTPIAGSAETDRIYIYHDVGLTNLELSQDATSPFTATLDDGTYYWFVKSSDAAGNAGSQSTVFAFTVNN